MELGLRTTVNWGCCGKEEHLHLCVVDTVVKYEIILYKLRFVERDLAFFLSHSGRLMPALAKVELHKWMITH